jgi:hypothetical protein
MAGKNNKAGRGTGGGSSGTTAPAKPRKMSEAQAVRANKVNYKAHGLLANTHQDNATARSMAKMPSARRSGFRDRMRARLEARGNQVHSARHRIARDKTAQAIRSLRKVDPAKARAWFKAAGRNPIPRGV